MKQGRSQNMIQQQTKQNRRMTIQDRQATLMSDDNQTQRIRTEPRRISNTFPPCTNASDDAFDNTHHINILFTLACTQNLNSTMKNDGINQSIRIETKQNNSS
jgi:hypothetical protein